MATAIPEPTRLLSHVRSLVYALTGLLVLSLVVVGTIAVIAEVKGTWHWSIHLESTVSFMGVFVSWLLAALVPAYGVLAVGRWWVDG